MRVRELKLTEFRSFKDAEVAGIPDFAVFGGNNGSGKSTILAALSFALTGTTPDADTGVGLDVLRRVAGNGAPARAKARISIAGEHGGRSFRLTRSENEGPRSAVQDEATRALDGIPRAVVRACLYGSGIFTMPEKDAQRLLQAVLGGEGVELPQEIAAEVSGIVRMSLVGKKLSLQELEGIHKTLYEARRDAGSAAKAMGDSVAMEPQRPSSVPRGQDPEDLLTKLAAKVAELDGALRQALQLAARQEGAQNRLHALEGDLAEAQRVVDGLPNAESIRIEATALLERRGKLMDEEAENSTRRAAAHAELGEARGTLKAAETALADVKKLKGSCDRCHRRMTEGARESLLRDLAETAKNASIRVQAAEGSVQAIPDPPDQGEITVALANLEGVEQRWVNARKAVEVTRHRLSTANEELAGTGPVATPDALETLRHRIEVGRGRMDELSLYIGALRAWEKGVMGRKAADERREKLDGLVRYFGPEGPMRAQLAGGDAVNAFHLVLLERMSAMGIQSIDFRPLLQSCEEALVNGRPVRTLSHAQRIYAGLAFAMAMADLTGFGLVAVDDFDALDEDLTVAAATLLAASTLQRLIFLTPKSGIGDFLRKAATRSSAGRGYYLIESRADGSTVQDAGARLQTLGTGQQS